MSFTKYSAEIKITIVKEYLTGKRSLGELSRIYKVDRKTIRDWVRYYEEEGIDAFQTQWNRYYSPELKQEAVSDYLSGGGSLADICRKYHIRAEPQLRNWIKVYNTHGDFSSARHLGGGNFMSKGRDTTQEERIQIVKDCLESGQNYSATAQKYNVSYQQVWTWTQRFQDMGAAGLEDRRGHRKKDQEPRTELEKVQIENEKLKHQLYMTEMERDLLKKLKELEGGEAYRK